jgi:enoyl-CoA hydratase/carnithine racemase
MDKLVIAAINGLTLGAALELALCCDVRIASEEAQLCEWFVRMGMTPLVGAYFLPRLVGVGRAKLIACTGDFIDAKEAERIGLVDKVVPGDKLMTTVEELARKILDRPIQTVGLIKRGINMSLKMDFESSLEYQSRLFYESVGTEDHRETVDAWIEKRKPILKGK